jgi:Tfp pilus assembly protein PilF
LSLSRRGFFWAAAALAFRSSPAATPFPVSFRRPASWDSARVLINPESDNFACEREAVRVESALSSAFRVRNLPLAEDFRGPSPAPRHYQKISEGLEEAVYGATESFTEGFRRWVDSFGGESEARFYPLAGGEVRYEVRAPRVYATGRWRMEWDQGRLRRFDPLGELRASASRPLFEDVTGALFGADPAFREQLAFGVPYWRARLDAAAGIDIYGNNGIAVGDIDGDGWDEIYVCQPGGLPNRLFRRDDKGVFVDITEQAGVGILDDTASALFLDLRNTGRQDLVVLTTAGPVLLLNRGGGIFEFKPEAFRSANAPQGTFTGMAAADYDRDGKLDLYLCTYIYFQSEDQYRYPSPYHDAQNGPPNFLFRNRLNPDGSGYFEDVTSVAGLDENNRRYSFAPAWCDYDGDGWPDLYVANDFGRNNLYKNEGGRFRDVAEPAGVVDIGPGMSSAWFDADGDGWPDLYVTNMWTAAGQRLAADPAFGPVARDGLAAAYRGHTRGNSLYRNRGDGRFDETTAGAEMGRWSWSADGIDFDCDGAPEIYIACGMLTGHREPDLMSFFWRRVVAESPATAQASESYEQGWNNLNQWIREGYSWNGHERNVLYLRRQDRYWDVSGISGLDIAADSRAFAVTDFDGDGRLDLIVKNRLGPQIRAFRNDCAGDKHSIAFDLTGASSNRDAIGAKIEVSHAGGKTTTWLSAGSGYLSQHTKRVFAGLGMSVRAAVVRITWPSGLVQEFRDLEAGFRYRIIEGNPEWERTPFASRHSMPAAPVYSDNRPEPAATWLVSPLALPIAPVRRSPHVLCVIAGSTQTPANSTPLDLRTAPAEAAAALAIFRRYLFDYRSDLELPFSLLVDAQGLVHKFYPEIPPAELIRADLHVLETPNRLRLALPFPGRYYHPPGRNLYRFAGAFLAAGYPAQALPYLREALAKAPDNARALLAAGQVYLELNQLAEARRYLERCLELNPSLAGAHNNLGGVAMAEGRYTEAARHFEEAIRLDPRATYALANGAQAHARAGNPARAEELFRRAMAVDPNDADTANQYGLLLARQNRLDEARRLFQQAIQARHDHAGAINNLGVLYMQGGQRDDALAAFQYGVEVAPADENLNINLARVLVAAGNRERARSVLTEFLKRNPASELARRAFNELER